MQTNQTEEEEESTVKKNGKVEPFLPLSVILSFSLSLFLSFS
jgi:hypothetical protein